jgi:hypothetical protein
MARKATRAKKVEPQDANDQPPQGGEAVSKAQAVRAAIDAGMRAPTEGVAFVKTRYGIDVSKPHFSAIKSNYKKKAAGPKGQPGRKPKGTIEGYLAPPPKPALNGEPDLLDAMEAMKPLVASLGPDKVKRIVDLLG